MITKWLTHGLWLVFLPWLSQVVEGCTASLVGAAMSGYMQRNSDNDEVRWVHFLHLIEGDNQRM